MNHPHYPHDAPDLPAAHTLREQLAQVREIERKRIIAESCERIIRDDDELHPHRLVLPLEGAD